MAAQRETNPDFGNFVLRETPLAAQKDKGAKPLNGQISAGHGAEAYRFSADFKNARGDISGFTQPRNLDERIARRNRGRDNEPVTFPDAIVDQASGKALELLPNQFYLWRAKAGSDAAYNGNWCEETIDTATGEISHVLHVVQVKDHTNDKGLFIAGWTATKDFLREAGAEPAKASRGRSKAQASDGKAQQEME